MVVEQILTSTAISISNKSPESRADIYLCDLLEGFAGEANPSKMAGDYNLTAAEPAEVDLGWDLATEEGRDKWKTSVRENKPWLTILGYPCTNWCIYNKNVNFQGPRRAILDARRMSEKEIKELTAWTMREQYDGGRWFLFENPPTSDVFPNGIGTVDDPKCTGN